MTTVSVKLLVQQPPGQPDLFLRPCGMRTIATDVARNVARLSEMPLGEGGRLAWAQETMGPIYKISYDNLTIILR